MQRKKHLSQIPLCILVRWGFYPIMFFFWLVEIFFIERNPTIPNNRADSIPRLNHWTDSTKSSWNSRPNLAERIPKSDSYLLEFFTSFWRFEKNRNQCTHSRGSPQNQRKKKTTPLLKNSLRWSQKLFFWRSVDVRNPAPGEVGTKKSHHLPGFYDHPKWLDIGYLDYQQYDPPFFPPPNHRPSSKSRRLASKKSKRSFTKRGDKFRSSKQPKWVANRPVKYRGKAALTGSQLGEKIS